MSSPEMAPVSLQTSTGNEADAGLRFELEHAVKNGANWFYWIAGLSLINSAIAFTGSNWQFILGLGITQVVDAIAREVGSSGTVAAVVVDAFIAGLFILFGVFANRRARWAFWTGMVLYALDAGLLIIAKDLLGVAFHAFALWSIWSGFAKLSQLEAMHQTQRAGAVSMG